MVVGLQEKSQSRHHHDQRRTRQKACNACTKSKRRCDLQHPSCRRCVVKGLNCVYSSTRLHDHVSGRISSSTTNSNSSPDTHQHALSVTGNGQQWLSVYHHQGCGLSQSDYYFLDNNLYTPTQPMQFFLSPDTWTVMDSSEKDRNRTRRSVPQLYSTVHQVQSWVRQWVEEGSNMFVHKRLYYSHGSSGGGDGAGKGRLKMPRCVQDAYATCAAYFSSTQRNKEMVLGIVEDRVAILLEEEGDPDDHLGGDHDKGINVLYDDLFLSEPPPPPPLPGIESDGQKPAKPGKPRNVLDHLARVQALFFYQTIRLFDGDPRSQITAESHIPVLSRWCKEMIDSALLSSQYVNSATYSALNTQSVNFEKKLNSDWNAWILAESVRRTWLVAGHMQCIYRLLSHGFTVCPGGVMFTTRTGLWQAESAYEWWAKLRERDVLFCPSLESGKRLLKPGETSPDDIDDFGRFVLRIIEGEERVDKWLAAS